MPYAVSTLSAQALAEENLNVALPTLLALILSEFDPLL